MSAIYQRTEHKGFQLASAETSFLQSVSLGIILPVGSRHEKGLPTGISHFAEHMIFKGTGNRSAEDIAREIEGSGASMNAYTTEDHTMLEMRGPEGTEELMLEVMADMIWHSNFDPEEIESECDVIEEEIIGYEESPSEHVHDLLSKAMWGDHPLGQPITGTSESIQNIDQKSLREFTNTFYHQKGITLASGGALSHKRLLDLADQYLTTANSDSITPLALDHYQPTEVKEERDIEQAHLCLGYQTVGRHSADRHAIRLMSLMLGETMSSRLFQKIREELGLCYSIHTDFTLFDDLGGFHVIAALDGDRFDYAQEAIDKVLNSFLNEGPTENELQRAKNYALSQNQLAMEGSQAFMQWAGDSSFCYDRIILPHEARANTAAVTLDDIRRVSSAIITPSNKATAIICPNS